jgi:hypothetical protein
MDMKIEINYDNTTFYDTVSEREGERERETLKYSRGG